MLPVFLYFTYAESRVNSFIAGLVYAVTGTTDFLDGWIARKKGLVTVIGKFLDPLADKFMVTGLRTIAMSEGIVIAAGREGKHKTAFQVAAITFLIIHYTYPVDAILFSFDLDGNRVGTWLLYVSVFFAVWSAWNYFRDFVRAIYGPAAPAARSPDQAGPPAPREPARSAAGGPGRGP